MNTMYGKLICNYITLIMATGRGEHVWGNILYSRGTKGERKGTQTQRALVTVDRRLAIVWLALLAGILFAHR